MAYSLAYQKSQIQKSQTESISWAMYMAEVVAAEVARHTLGKAATSATAGLAASTLATTAGGSGATATVVSVTGIATAPLLAPLAVGAVAAYGVSKLWEWLND